MYLLNGMKKQDDSVHINLSINTIMEKYKLYLWISVLAILVFTSSCSNIYEDGKELAADTKPYIEEITVDELSVKMDNQDDFYLIDVRQSAEFEKGNIFYATHIPRGMLEFKIGNEAFWEGEYMSAPEKYSAIIIYCKKGDRGILATKTLSELGYTNVKNLSGGMVAWDPEFESDSGSNPDEGGCGG